MDENQQPKITGPSNSRFHSREREPLTQISFDRMTVIGDLNPRHINEFRSFIASNPYVSVLDTKTDYVRAKMDDDCILPGVRQNQRPVSATTQHAD